MDSGTTPPTSSSNPLREARLEFSPAESTHEPAEIRVDRVPDANA
jgi:hypothetical protein